MTNEQQSEATVSVPGGEIQKPRRSVSLRLVVAAVVILVLVGLAALLIYYKSVFIAATVDGKPISRLSVMKELEKQSGQQALDALINERLINNEAQAKNISITDDEIRQEITKVEDQLKQQSTTLEAELEAQNVTREDFDRQVVIQKQAEKLLEDKIGVSDEEVQKYITDNQVDIPEGKDAELKSQVRDQLKGQKFGSEIATLLSDLRAKAKINQYVNY
jgi:foldase protein PrsA